MNSGAGSSVVVLRCVAGPDAGKRLAVTTEGVLIGRASACALASDDPEVAAQHVRVWLQDGQPQFVASDGCAAFVDGQRLAGGALLPGQQLRIGRSFWQRNDSRDAKDFSAIIEDLGGRISAAAGVDRIEGFNLRAMFSEVWRKRSDDELEEYFAAGTRTTTPALATVATGWPKPWLFVRTFGLAVLVYYAFVFAYHMFDNALLLPGLVTIGAFVIPFSLLMFFFEMNVLRNVPLYQLVKLLFLGGILSVILALFLFQWTRLETWLGAMSAGLIEETGKAAALLLVINKPKYRWLLNGMLFGAAVGVGFAAFESAGYAYVTGVDSGREAMLSNITRRGVLSICGGHVLWTALAGAALWRVRGAARFEWAMLQDPRFLRVFGLCVGLHMVWNSPLQLPLNLKYIVLGFVVWVALLSYIQTGLRQVREAQASDASAPAASRA